MRRAVVLLVLGGAKMPWSADNAPNHTKKADTAAKRAKWARVANAVLRRSGGNDALAIRVANSRMESASSLFDRITESDAPTFLGSVHNFVKAADISDPDHPWHKIFTGLGEIGDALRDGRPIFRSRSNIQAPGRFSSDSPSAHTSTASGRAIDMLRATKRGARQVGRERRRVASDSRTLRAIGRSQPGTGAKRVKQTNNRRRSKVDQFTD